MPSKNTSAKRKWITLVIISMQLFCNPGLLNAVSSSGTIMPETGQWEAGSEINLTFKREVKDYQNVKSIQYFYNLSFGFADWFSFDGKLGAGDITVKPVSKSGAHYHTNFAGGYGWRAKLFGDKKHDIKGIWGFQHVSVHPSCKKIDGISHDIIWDDWQIQALVFKELGNVHPYCGMKWSLLYLIRRIAGDWTKRHSRDSIGLIVGTDLRMNDYIFVNIEGRFFDETALSTGFTIRY